MSSCLPLSSLVALDPAFWWRWCRRSSDVSRHLRSFHSRSLAFSTQDRVCVLIPKPWLLSRRLLAVSPFNPVFTDFTMVTSVAFRICPDDRQSKNMNIGYIYIILTFSIFVNNIYNILSCISVYPFAPLVASGKPMFLRYVQFIFRCVRISLNIKRALSLR